MTATQLANALVEKGTVTVSLTKPHYPHAFYRTGPELYVYEDFRSRIVSKATPTVQADPATLRKFVLAREAIGKEIEVELGNNYLFHETEVCWIIAEMLVKQAQGEPGDLDNSGKANLFYTPSFVVNVLWSADVREWGVLAWRRGGDGWDRGDSAFSRN